MSYLEYLASTGRKEEETSSHVKWKAARESHVKWKAAHEDEGRTMEDANFQNRWYEVEEQLQDMWQGDVQNANSSASEGSEDETNEQGDEESEYEASDPKETVAERQDVKRKRIPSSKDEEQQPKEAVDVAQQLPRRSKRVRVDFRVNGYFEELPR
jgi:hypothetical protein